MRRNAYIGVSFVVVIITLAIASSVLERKAAVEAAGVQAPTFEVDPFWPKPLPNHWLIGMTIGVSVDAQEHVWIVHRQGSSSRVSCTLPVTHQLRSAAPRLLPFLNSIRPVTSSDTGAVRVRVTTGRIPITG